MPNGGFHTLDPLYQLVLKVSSLDIDVLERHLAAFHSYQIVQKAPDQGGGENDRASTLQLLTATRDLVDEARRIVATDWRFREDRNASR